MMKNVLAHAVNVGESFDGLVGGENGYIERIKSSRIIENAMEIH